MLTEVPALTYELTVEAHIPGYSREYNGLFGGDEQESGRVRLFQRGVERFGQSTLL